MLMEWCVELGCAGAAQLDTPRGLHVRWVAEVLRGEYAVSVLYGKENGRLVSDI